MKKVDLTLVVTLMAIGACGLQAALMLYAAWNGLP